MIIGKVLPSRERLRDAGRDIQSSSHVGRLLRRLSAYRYQQTQRFVGQPPRSSA